MGRGKVNWGGQAAGFESDDDWFKNDDSLNDNEAKKGSKCWPFSFRSWGSLLSLDSQTKRHWNPVVSRARKRLGPVAEWC